MFCKKGVLKNFTKIQMKTTMAESPTQILAQVFFCEFCEIFKNIFFHKIPPVAVSEINNLRFY